MNPFGFPFELDQSTNSGSTWTQEVVSNSQVASQDPGSVLFPPIATDPTSSSRVLLAANAVYASTDNGVTWSKQSSSYLTPSTCTSGVCAIDDLQFAPSDGTVAYAISATDGVAPFTISYSGNANLNSSATWTNITGTPPFSGISIEPTSIAVSPVNSKQAYVSFANHGLIANPIYTVTVTTNGAAATSAIWQPVAGGGLPPSTPVDKLLLDKTESYWEYSISWYRHRFVSERRRRSRLVSSSSDTSDASSRSVSKYIWADYCCEPWAWRLAAHYIPERLRSGRRCEPLFEQSHRARRILRVNRIDSRARTKKFVQHE
jgi:hypothetical protein